MGVQTISCLSPETTALLSVIDTVCLGIFLSEMLLKIAAYRSDYFRDVWNWFDMIINHFAGIGYVVSLGIQSFQSSAHVPHA